MLIGLSLNMLIGLSLFVLAILVAIQFDRETQNVSFLSPLFLSKEEIKSRYGGKKIKAIIQGFVYAFGFIVLMSSLTVFMSRFIFIEGIENGFLQGTGYLRDEAYFQEDTIYIVQLSYRSPPIYNEGRLVLIEDEHSNSILWHIKTAPIDTIRDGVFMVDRDKRGNMSLRDRAHFTDEEKKRYENYRNKQV